MGTLWTLGKVAEVLDVPEHRIQYLFRSRKVPEVRRVGGRRVFTLGDVQGIAEVLERKQAKVRKTAQKGGGRQ